MDEQTPQSGAGLAGTPGTPFQDQDQQPESIKTQAEQARQSDRETMRGVMTSMSERRKDLGGFCVPIGHGEHQAVLLTTALGGGNDMYIFATEEGYKTLNRRAATVLSSKRNSDDQALDDYLKNVREDKPVTGQTVESLGYFTATMPTGISRSLRLNLNKTLTAFGDISNLEGDAASEVVERTLRGSIEAAAAPHRAIIERARINKEIAQKVTSILDAAPPKI